METAVLAVITGGDRRLQREGSAYVGRHRVAFRPNTVRSYSEAQIGPCLRGEEKRNKNVDTSN